MAPARMISFMEDHVAECPICLADPDIHNEIAKIKEIILPESKIPKAVRIQNEQAVAAEEEEEEETGTEDSSSSETDVYHDDDDFSEEEPDLVDGEQ